MIVKFLSVREEPSDIGPIYGLKLQRNANDEVILGDNQNYDARSEYTSRVNSPTLGALETENSRDTFTDSTFIQEGGKYGARKKVGFLLDSYDDNIWDEDCTESDSFEYLEDDTNMSRMGKGIELLSNPYSGSKHSKNAQGVKQWQKPKHNLSMYRLAYGGGRSLRATRSTEHLNSAGASRSEANNPFQDVYLEYVDNRNTLSTMPRRPKSVSEYAAMQRQNLNAGRSAGALRSTSLSTQEQMDLARSMPASARTKQRMAQMSYASASTNGALSASRYRGPASGGHRSGKGGMKAVFMKVL